MSRILLIALATLAIGTALVRLERAVTADVDPALTAPQFPPRAGPARGPDGHPLTAAPNWRLLSEDVGMLLEEEDPYQPRAQLYVRIDGVWLPVALDPPAAPDVDPETLRTP